MKYTSFSLKRPGEKENTEVWITQKQENKKETPDERHTQTDKSLTETCRQ